MSILGSQPYIGGREPNHPVSWSQTLIARCGAHRIRISGYGPARPLNRTALILIDGKRLKGDSIPQLLSDLSHRQAVYRLGILCDDSRITLRIGEGEKQLDGTIRYRSGAASIGRSKLEGYTGLQETSADAFWFR